MTASRQYAFLIQEAGFGAVIARVEGQEMAYRDTPVLERTQVIDGSPKVRGRNVGEPDRSFPAVLTGCDGSG